MIWHKIKLFPHFCHYCRSLLFGHSVMSNSLRPHGLQHTRLPCPPLSPRIYSNSKQQPTPVLLPGKSHGQRSLVGYSPWGHKESDTTEWLHFMSIESGMPPKKFILCCPLSPPAFNLSQHHSPFQWVGSSHQVAKVLELQLHHQSFQWIFRTDFL